jgi:DNA-binding response OmpR family regulator
MSQVPQSGLLTTGNPALVLITSVDEPLADTIAFVVVRAGFTAHITLHGRKALEAVRMLRPALLIVGMILPDIEAATLITTVRSAAAASGIAAPPIIVMTSGSLAEARAAGGDRVLHKPFAMQDLEALLHRYLD